MRKGQRQMGEILMVSEAVKRFWFRLGNWQKFWIFVSMTLGVIVYGLMLYKADPGAAPSAKVVAKSFSPSVQKLSDDYMVLFLEKNALDIIDPDQVLWDDEPKNNFDDTKLPPTLRKVLKGQLPPNTQIYNSVDIELSPQWVYTLRTEVSMPKAQAEKVLEDVHTTLDKLKGVAINEARLHITWLALAIFSGCFALAAVVDLAGVKLDAYRTARFKNEAAARTQGFEAAKKRAFEETALGR